MTTKKCTKCGETKSASEFHREKTGIDGLTSRCRICRNKSHRLDDRKHPHRKWAYRTLYKHNLKGYEIRISTNELTQTAKQTTHCEICDCELAWFYGNKNGKPLPNSPTLDRINNSNVLSKNTVQILCMNCNASKGARTMKEMLEFCQNFVDKFSIQKCFYCKKVLTKARIKKGSHFCSKKCSRALTMARLND